MESFRRFCTVHGQLVDIAIINHWLDGIQYLYRFLTLLITMRNLLHWLNWASSPTECKLQLSPVVSIASFLRKLRILRWLKYLEWRFLGLRPSAGLVCRLDNMCKRKWSIILDPKSKTRVASGLTKGLMSSYDVWYTTIVFTVTSIASQNSCGFS